MFKIAQRLSATTACFVFLFVNTPAATLAQEAAPLAGSSQTQTSALNVREGTQVFDAATLDSVSSVKISRGATAVIDFGGASQLKLPGNLVNKGNLFVGSSNQAVTAAQISAANIVNRPRALLSSVLPNGGVGGFTSSVANLDLVLSAVQNILNQGTIRSSGSLSLNAGGSIVNQATIQAAQNVNFNSAIGSIANSGLISAMAGNINIASQTVQNMLLNNVNVTSNLAHDIMINGLGGQLQALMGSINVGDPDSTADYNIDLNGGDWLSREMNLYAGTGAITAQLGKVTGPVSTHAGSVHLGANTQTLCLGEISVTGDPTYYNPTGNIEITGNITVGERLAILAAGDITSNVGGLAITARDGAGQGYDITMVAGASLSGAGGDTTNTIGTTPPVVGNATGNVTVNGPSPTGGNIVFSGVPGVQIRANSTGPNLDGGNVTLLAFSNQGNGGRVSLPVASVIDASGAGAGAGGNVTIIAGGDGSQTPVVAVGNVNTTGNSGGNIEIRTAQPTVSPGGVTFDTSGMITSGSFGSGSITGGANVDVQTGNLASRATAGTGGDISVTAGGDITGGIMDSRVLGNGNGGAITLTAGGDITANGLILSNVFGNGNGGAITLTAGGDITSPGVILSSVFGNGNGGAITLTAGTDFSAGGIDSSVSGNGNGGAIALTVGGDITTQGVILSSAFGNGNGGAVTLTAGGDVTAGDSIDSHVSGIGNGGATSVTAGGNITANGPILSFVSHDGTGGAITLTAGGDITATNRIASGVSVFGFGDGGAISLTAGRNITVNGIIFSSVPGNGNGNEASGAITLTAGGDVTASSSIISGVSANGNGGAITLTAGGDISAGSIESSVSGNGIGGAITITAGGNITAADNLNSSVGAGTGGAISVTAGGDFTAGNSIISGAFGDGSGGAIALSSVGNITTGDINSSGTGGGGTINFASVGNTTAGNIDSSAGGLGIGGAMTLSSGGDITAGNIDSHSNAGVSGGAITLSSGGNITAGEILSRCFGGGGIGGAITLSSAVNITAGNIDSSPSFGGTGAGAITLSSGGYISAGDIVASGRSIVGAITLSSGGNITAGQVLSIGQGFIGSNGGTITVSAGGNITAVHISTLSVFGNGGTISLTSGGNVTAEIISSIGGAADGTGNGGSIFITLNSPAAFQIGDLQQVRAEGGEIAGDGGHITVRNSGLGGIDVTNLNFSRISVAAPGGSGGSIELDAGFGAIAGPLSFPAEGGTLAAVGGAGAGGSITLRGSTTNLSSLQNPLTLDVSGTTTGGSISVATTDSSANADITLGVNTGQVNLTTGGFQDSGSITVNSGHDIVIANDVTSGNVILAASNGGSSVSLAPSTKVQTSGNIAIITATLQLGAGSLVSTSGASSTINIASPAGSDLTIQVPPGLSATIQAASTSFAVCCTDQFPPLGLPSSGSINIAPASGQALVLSGWGLPTLGTLNLNGSVIVTTQNASITNDAAVVSTGPIFMFVDNGTLFNNGTIWSTAPTAMGFADDSRGGITTNQITVGIISRNGPLTLDRTKSIGAIIATGTGQVLINSQLATFNAEIWIASYGSDINVNSPTLFGTSGFSSSGFVLVEAKNGYQNGALVLPAGAINVANNAVLSVNSPRFDASLVLQSPTINLGENALLFCTNSSSATNGIIIRSSADPGVPSPLTINLAGSAVLNTNGSLVNINTNANGVTVRDQTLTLQSTGTAILQSNAPLVFLVTNGTFIDNNVAITSSSPGVPGVVTAINFSGGLNTPGVTNSITMAGIHPGTITVTSSTANGIAIVSSGSGSAINFMSSYTFNGANGTVLVQNRLPSSGDQPGSINLAPGITLTSARPLQLTTQSLNLGANSSVISTVTSGSGISVLSSINGPKPLTINLPGGSSATMSTLGGSISFLPSSGNGVTTTVAPAVDQPIAFITTGGSAALYLNGGSVSTATANASTTNGSITIGAGVTVSSDRSISITTPQLILNDEAVINSFATSTINLTSPAGSDLTILAPSGGSATIQTAGGILSYSAGGQPISGGINVTPASGQALLILKSGTDPAMLNLNGGAVVTTTNSANTTVGSGVTFASDSLIVMNVNNGTLFNNGLITSSAAGNSAQFNSTTALVYKFASAVTIESLSGSLTLDGNGLGQISATGSGGVPIFFNICMCTYDFGPNISVFAYAPGSVNINASYTFNTPAPAFTTIGKVNTSVSGAVNTAGSINIGANVTITQIGGSMPGLPASRQIGAINLSAPTVSFGAGTSIISLNSSTTDIRITGNQFDTTNVPLTLTLPDSANVSLVAGGGLVLIEPGVRTASGGFNIATTSLTYAKSAGTGATSLDVIGGPLSSSSNTSTVIGDNIQVSGTNGVRMNSGLLTLGADSSIFSSLAFGTAISIFSNRPTGLTINLPDGASATISTGGGSIFVGPAMPFPIGSPPGTPPTPLSDLPLLFAKSPGTGIATLNLTGGAVTVQTTNASTTIASSVTLSSDSSINIITPQLILNNGSVISSSATSTINITSSAGENLTIQGPSGGSATIQIGGGVLSYSPGGQPILGGINITPAFGQALIFAKSGLNPAILNLNGGPVVGTTTNSSTTVASGVTVASDSLMVWNVNNGTLFNSGLITSSAPGNSPQFNSTTAQIFRWGSAVTIESLSGSLTLGGDGLGQVSTTGSGGFPLFFNGCRCTYDIGPDILVLAHGPDSINVNASYTFNTGVRAFTLIGKVNRDVSGAVNIAGSVNIGPNVTITQIGGALPQLPSRQLGAITFSTPELAFGAGSSVVSQNNSTTDIRITSNHFDSTQVPLLITLPDSASASLITSTGSALIVPSVRTASGSFATSVTPLTFSKASGTGVTSLDVTGQLFASAVNTFVGSDVELSGTENVSVFAQVVTMGAGSSLTSIRISGNAIAVGSPAVGLTINLPDSGSVTMTTSGGSIFLGPGMAGAIGAPPTPLPNLPLVFAKSAGSGTTTLNLFGGPVTIQTTNASTTIGSSVTLNSDNTIAIMVMDSTFHIDGTITSSVAAANGFNSWRAIDIRGNGGLITLEGGPGSKISATGDPTLRAGYLVGPGIVVGVDSINTVIKGSVTFDLTPLGVAVINSGQGQEVSFEAGANVAVHGGSSLPAGTLPSGSEPFFTFTPLTVNAQRISFGANTTVSSDRTSGNAILLANSNSAQFTVAVTDKSTATLSTAGGTVLISPTAIQIPPQHLFPRADTSLTFSNSAGTNYTGVATLNVTGGPVVTYSVNADTNIDPGTTLASNSSITINVNGGAFINNGSVVCSGCVSSSPAIAVQSTSNLTVTGTGILSGSLIQASSTVGSVSLSQQAVTGVLTGSAVTGFSATVASGGLQGGSIAVSNGSVTLIVQGGALTVAPGAIISSTEGNIRLQNNDLTSSISIGSGATLTASSAVSDFLGNVYVVMGPVPANPVKGPDPANLTINQANGGQITFGSNGITALCCNNTANVDGARVVLDTGALPASRITLGGNVTINATNPPGLGPFIPPPGQGGSPPGQGGELLPGMGGSAAAQGNGLPFVNGVIVPGSGGTVPGQGGVPSGVGLPAGEATPPGQGDTPAGQAKKVSYAADKESAKCELIPVSFVESIAPLGTPHRQIVTYEHGIGSVRHDGQARLTFLESGLVNLQDGEILVSSSKQIRVEAGDFTVTLAPGTIAVVSRHNGAVSVRTLHDSRGSSTRVYGGGKEIARISAGQEVVTATDGTALSTAISRIPVGRRRMELRTGNGNQMVAHCDVSPLSVIQNSNVLTNLMHSLRNSDRAIVENVLKTAACLQTVTGRYGAYQAAAH